MKATKSGNFNPVPLPEPQTTLARCYSIIDIGTVPNFYQNKLTGHVRKIYITWEFPELLAIFNEEKGEEPFVIGLELTASTSENSNLAKLISQWRNKPLTDTEQEGFDPSIMIGKTAFISFIHKRRPKFEGKDVTKITNENTNLKFNGIMPKPKTIEAPPNRNSYMNWDWDKVAVESFEVHKATFEKIPKWLQKKMAESKEFKEYSNGYKVEGVEESTEDAPPTFTATTGTAPKTVEGEW